VFRCFVPVPFVLFLQILVQTWKVQLLQMLPNYEQNAIQKFNSQLKLQPNALCFLLWKKIILREHMWEF
jgi:hypothetical protein